MKKEGDQRSQRHLLPARIGIAEPPFMRSIKQIEADSQRLAEIKEEQFQQREVSIKNTIELDTHIRKVTHPFEEYLKGIAQTHETHRQEQVRKDYIPKRWDKVLRRPIQDVDKSFTVADKIFDSHGTQYDFRMVYSASGQGEKRIITPIDYMQSTRTGESVASIDFLDPATSGNMHITLENGHITNFQIPIYDRYENSAKCEPKKEDQPILFGLSERFQGDSTSAINLVFSLHADAEPLRVPTVRIVRYGYGARFDVSYQFDAVENNFTAPTGGLDKLTVAAARGYPSAFNSRAFLNLLDESLSLIPSPKE